SKNGSKFLKKPQRTRLTPLCSRPSTLLGCRCGPTTRRRFMRFACPALALAVALLLLSCSRGPAPAGVTVASLDPAGGAARAGLRVGDVLLSWQRDKSTGAAGAEGALGRVPICPGWRSRRRRRGR